MLNNTQKYAYKSIIDVFFRVITQIFFSFSVLNLGILKGLKQVFSLFQALFFYIYPPTTIVVTAVKSSSQTFDLNFTVYFDKILFVEKICPGGHYGSRSRGYRAP